LQATNQPSPVLSIFCPEKGTLIEKQVDTCPSIFLLMIHIGLNSSAFRRSTLSDASRPKSTAKYASTSFDAHLADMVKFHGDIDTTDIF
jgi:hypothetical protein